MDYTFWIGIIGMCLILIGFLLNVLQKMKSTSITYLVLNFFGSAFLAAYAYLIYSIPFLILNIIWMFAPVYEYWHIHHKKTRRHRY